MSEALSNNIICSGYLLLWILTFIGYHILRFKTDGGSAIMLTYIIYAIFSLFSILCKSSTKTRFGAPGGIRTPDLKVRSLAFYPAKLRAHF